MTIFWSEEVDKILSIGLPLFDQGTNNWALTKDEALLAIQDLSEKNIAILGGDVYQQNNSSVEQNYDNWYCNVNTNELNADFVSRSKNKAIEYINNYPCGHKLVYFVLVPKV